MNRYTPITLLVILLIGLALLVGLYLYSPLLLVAYLVTVGAVLAYIYYTQ